MVRRILSALLLVSLALPAIQKVDHALEGHLETQCQEDIPNHFHSREFDCSFDRYLLLPVDLTATFSLDLIQITISSEVSELQEQVFISNSISLKQLRAPPTQPDLPA